MRLDISNKIKIEEHFQFYRCRIIFYHSNLRLEKRKRKYRGLIFSKKPKNNRMAIY